MNTQVEQTEFNDEISISDIVSKVWRRRGVVLAGLLTGLLLGAGTAFITSNSATTIAEYYISLPAIRSNDDIAEYPNGTQFSPQDLLGPEVITQLAQATGIESAEALREALSIENSSPIAAGIIAKYRSRLQARNISGTEIDTLNRDLQEELEQATINTLRLTVNFQALGVNEATAHNILTELPSAWSNVYTNQFRILDDPELAISVANTPQPLSTDIGLVQADNIVEDIRRGLNIMAEDNRLAGLQTSDGRTPFNLLLEINSLSNLYLAPLLSSRRGNGTIVDVHINQFRIEEQSITQKLRGIRETIDDIRSVLNRQSEMAPGQLSSGSEQVQVDGTALNQIIGLANQGQLSIYLTDLFDQQRELQVEQASLNSKVKQLTSVTELDNSFVSLVENNFAKIIEDYNNLMMAAQEIVRAQGTVLYRPIGAPIVNAQSPLRMGATFITAGGFLGFALSLLLVFVLPARRKSS